MQPRARGIERDREGVSEREMYTHNGYIDIHIYTNGKDRSLLPVLQKKEHKKI